MKIVKRIAVILFILTGIFALALLVRYICHQRQLSEKQKKRELKEVVIDVPEAKYAEAIADIYAEGWKQTIEGKLAEEDQRENVERWYHPERIEKDIAEGNYSYIALLDSEVIGVIGGGKIGPHTGEIFVFYVDEKMKDQGVGEKLLEKLTQEHIEAGLSKQSVSVQKGNERGMSFYEARGFRYQERNLTETATGEQQVSLRYSRRIVRG